MGMIKTFRSPEISLWQSAVDAVAAREAGAARAAARGAEAGPPPRPDMNDPLVAAAARAGEELEAAAGGAAERGLLGDMATFFGQVRDEAGRAAADLLAGRLDFEVYRQRLFTQFNQYDPRWVASAVEYTRYFVLGHGAVPYRRHRQPGDFDLPDKLPDQARVALVADWGTGQPDAFRVLEQVARKKPDVFIHLGDIYYSGTEEEVRRAFLEPCREVLRPGETGCAIYTLSGNHDMYSGGHAYYALLHELGQPASYFCLRNRHWQFLALDTGLHGRYLPDRPTYLEDTELAWLRAKLAEAGGRKNVLLSHHQLFTAYESINDGPVNERLLGQLAPLLPQVALWFWGHEHNFVIYEKYRGFLARCVGHGAIPVTYTGAAPEPRFADVPRVDAALGNGPAFYHHGYALLTLNGPAALIQYYQDSDEERPLYVEEVS